MPCSDGRGRGAGFAFALYFGLRSDPEGLTGLPEINDALFNVAAGNFASLVVS
jgi:hypothetical protein